MRGSWRDERYPPASEPYKSPWRMGGILIAALAFTAALDGLGVISDVAYFDLVDRAINEGTVTAEEGNAADDRQRTIAVAQIAMFLVTGVIFIVWFRRCYRNLGALGIAWLRFKPGWAVGTWFVPLLNLIRTKEIANDIWRASDPALPPRVDGPGLGRPVSPLIDWWWVVLLIGGSLSRRSFSAGRAETLEEFADAGPSIIGADAAALVTSIMAIIVVKLITERQERRYALVLNEAAALRRTPPPPPPPPVMGPA